MEIQHGNGSDTLFYFLSIKRKPGFLTQIIARLTIIAMFLIISGTLRAQQYRFSFGTRPVKGFTNIGTQKNIENTDYGFEYGAKLVFSNHFVTANAPFFFSVNLPDGNYDVTVSLGDEKGTSATEVRAECRRMFLRNVKTKKGELATYTFTVHVRDSFIRDEHNSIKYTVKLKPREKLFLHWDNKLTLEFNDSLPKLRSIIITPNKKAKTIFLAGNSTVVDQAYEPWAAWGQMFPYFLKPGKICVANYAESGETLKAFAREKRLEKIFSLARPGDYLFIEFAHNDQKPGGNYLHPFTSYKDTLKSWIRQAREHKLVPVPVTSMHRRNFDSLARIINTLQDYPEAMRQTGKEQHVTVLDLNALSKTLYEAWGPQESVKAFVHYPAQTFAGQDSVLADNTHFNAYGAYNIAECVVAAIKKKIPEIAAQLKADLPPFQPQHPAPASSWYWPLSPQVSRTKPDGN